jgi:ubiquinone/menaquinone biosynthesis C-methylase UbiE
MGYGPVETSALARRTAAGHAAFFTAHLKPGMRVVDCGCGPGSITLGLAEAIGPTGSAVGFEVEQSLVDWGNRLKKESGRDNVEFQLGHCYELPFADNSFDAALISAVLGNLRDPARGLREVFRILKPGGLLGVKEFDLGGDLVFPKSPEMKQCEELVWRYRAHNGHHPESGRKSFGWVEAAGFDILSAKGVYETNTDPNVLRGMAEDYVKVIWEAWSGPFQELGWATLADIERITESYGNFPPKDGGAFVAIAWCEVLARKPAHG